MNYIGISSGFHDAAISVIDGTGNILYAGHSERYSKNKHDKNICESLLHDALQHTNSADLQYHYYERPWLKSLRQLRSGEDFVLPSWKKLLGSTYHQMGEPKIKEKAAPPPPPPPPVGPVGPTAPVGPATVDAAPVGPVGPATVEAAPVGPVGPTTP